MILISVDVLSISYLYPKIIMVFMIY